MISFLFVILTRRYHSLKNVNRPNVGGPVGIASLYVDPALGFALGEFVNLN